MLAQPVVMQCRPGAASVIATRLATEATVDGPSMLSNSNAMAMNQIRNQNAGSDVEK